MLDQIVYMLKYYYWTKKKKKLKKNIMDFPAWIYCMHLKETFTLNRIKYISIDSIFKEKYYIFT